MPSMIQKHAIQPINFKCALELEEQINHTEHLGYKLHLFISLWNGGYSIKTKREFSNSNSPGKCFSHPCQWSINLALLFIYHQITFTYSSTIKRASIQGYHRARFPKNFVFLDSKTSWKKMMTLLTYQIACSKLFHSPWPQFLGTL